MQEIYPNQDDALSSDEVASYLRSHPHFFEDQASLLAEIFLPSPHGNGTISLTERQQLAQRDKIRVTEVMLAKLIEFGEQNDQTSHKVHRLSVNLIENKNFDDLQELVNKSMQEVFAVTQSQVRIWLKPMNQAITQNVAFTPVSDAFSDWVISLNAPHCGTKPELADGLLDSQLQSFAFIPLLHISKSLTTEKKPAFGVLILGSDDPERFKADMGLMYLKRIGELVSASFASYFNE